MSDRDLRSRALTMSFSDGPSMSIGSSLHRPNNSNLAGPLPQARQVYILSSSAVLYSYLYLYLCPCPCPGILAHNTLPCMRDPLFIVWFQECATGIVLFAFKTWGSRKVWLWIASNTVLLTSSHLTIEAHEYLPFAFGRHNTFHSVILMSLINHVQKSKKFNFFSSFTT